MLFIRHKMKFENLIAQIKTAQQCLSQQTARSVNIAISCRNWLIGCYIVEFEQKGEDKANYGERLLKCLEEKINVAGLTERRFREFRRLYIVYPQLGAVISNYLGTNQEGISIRQTASAESQNIDLQLIAIRRTTSADLEKWQTPPEKLLFQLPYSHLLLISKIDEPIKRAFYESETIRGCWSYKELERQINSLYFERCGLSKDKQKLSLIVNQNAHKLEPTDVINNPMSLDHRILKCHVIVELKTDKFKHEYASQLNLYLNYYKNEMMQHDDNPPIGLLLCTDYGKTTVRYATAGMDENIFVSKYKINLPTENELQDYLSKIEI